MPFVPINCAAIPETLLESEIFGHEKGAFTGAFERRAGLLRARRSRHALPRRDRRDDAGDAGEAAARAAGAPLPPPRRPAEQPVDVRVIAATNVDPADAVQKGKLREDLYYRLNVFAIALPPLRERQGGPAAAGPGVPQRVQRSATSESVLAVDQEAMRILEQLRTGRATSASCAT